MRPLLHDFTTTLTSKSTIVVVALMVVLAVGLAPIISGRDFTGGIYASGIMFRDSTGYHFIVYATNEFGQPLSGVPAEFNLTSPAHGYTATATTNSSGLVEATINAPVELDYVGNVAIQETGSFVKSVFNVPNLTPGEIVPLHPIEHLFSTVTDPSNSSARLVNLFYSGLDGARPSSDSVYFGVFLENVTRSWNLGPYGSIPQVNQTDLTSLGTLNDYHQTYGINIPANQVCSNRPTPCDDQVYIALYSQNNTLLYSSLLPETDLYPPPASLVPSNDLASQFFTNALGIFVPLVAILGSFSSYGREKVSGVLESVLTRPVTRRGLVLSRLLSTFLGLSIAVLAAMGTIDLVLYAFKGNFVSTWLMIGSGLAFLTELATFIGIMFLVSHLVKSNGQLIGVGVALFLVLDFLAGLIVVPVAELIGAGPGTVGYIQATIIADLLNPAQLISLVVVFLTSRVPGVGLPIQPAAYGLTWVVLTIVCLLWIIGPIVILLRVASRRD